MSDVDLVEAVRVLRDEVLETVEHGDRDPPGAEIVDALLRALAIGGESVPGLDLQLHDSVARRLAWGDTEEAVLSDAEQVFDRVLIDRFPERRKLVRTLGWIERSAFASFMAYHLSAQHYQQAAANQAYAQQMGFK